MKARVTIKGRVAEHLKALGPAIDKVRVKSLLHSAILLETEVRARLYETNKHGRGQLEDSYKARMLTDRGKTLSAGVFSNSRYARIQDQGGVIKAKRGEYLHFKGSEGWAKVKQVRIPARRYLKHALEKAAPRIIKIISGRILKSVKKVVAS